MRGIGWQDVAVAVIAVAAFAFLVWRRRRKPAPKPQIVTLGRAPRRSPGNGVPNG